MSPTAPAQCGHHHHYAPAEISDQQRKTEEEGDYQVWRKYKAKDIILRIVSLKVIIPDRSGWLFKFLKTAEECKVGAQTRAEPPTGQLSSNVTKFSNHPARHQ